MLGASEMTGTSIATAMALPSATGRWIVQYTMTRAGSLKWNALARRELHKYLAIVIGDHVVSAAVIEGGQSKFTPFPSRILIPTFFSRSEAVSVASFMGHSS